MNKRILYQGLAATTLTAVALAHHVSVPLSFQDGPTILTEIVHYRLPDMGNVGVPSYRIGSEEHALHLIDGASFSVLDATGALETVVLSAADFADIGHATRHEVIAALNSRLTLARALENNSTLFLRGLRGGSSALLHLQDGVGSPLAALGLGSGPEQGHDLIRLVLSQPPLDHHDGGQAKDLAGHPYLLMMSATDGSFTRRGVEVPLGWDATLQRVNRLMRTGVLPSFLGHLDANADAEAVFDPALLELLFPQAMPEAVYFAFVVFSMDGSRIELVSNRFTVRIQG